MPVPIVLMIPALPLLLAGLLLVFIPSLQQRDRSVNSVAGVGLFASIVLLGLVSAGILPTRITVGDVLAATPMSLSVAWLSLLLIGMLQLIPWEQGVASQQPSPRGLLLLSSAAFLLVGFAQELITLVILLELVQFPLMALFFSDLQRKGESKRILRFYLSNLLSTLLILYGIAFFFGLTGTTHLTQIERFVTASHGPRSWFAPAGIASRWDVVSLVLITAGLGIRMGLVPFHFGQVEFQDQLTLRQQGTLAVLGRGSAAIVLLRIAPPLWRAGAQTAMVFFLILSAASLIILSTQGLRAKTLSRIWQSLINSQGGLICLALVIHFWEVTNPVFSLVPGRNLPGGEGIAMFLLAGNLLTVAGLTCLWGSASAERPFRVIEDCSGLARSYPLLAISVGMLLMNLAGIPPFPGFWARILLLLGAFSVHVESVTSSVTGPHGGVVVLAGFLVFQTLTSLNLAIRIIGTLCFDAELGVLKWFSRGLAGGFLAATLLLAAGLLPAPILHHLYLLLNR